MSRRGREAALPPIGSERTWGLRRNHDALVVRCFDEATSTFKDFDFERLDVSVQLREMLAAAFAARTAPGGKLTSMASMHLAYRAAVQLAEHVATLVWRPVLPEHLLPEHLDGVLASRSGSVSAARDLEHVKLLLAHAEGLSEAMRGKLGEKGPRRLEGQRKESLSRAEWKRVAETARADLRAAAARIRGHRETLRAWRAGELPDDGDLVVQRRMELMESADRAGDVPRAWAECHGREAPLPWVKRYGEVADVVSWLHLSRREALAGAVLMGVLTGENPSVILSMPAAHHRPDGYTGDVGTAIVAGRKPRRDRHQHMSLVLSEVPDWISIPDDPQSVSTRDELHTAFGLYTLLHELTARSRKLISSERLLVRQAQGTPSLPQLSERFSPEMIQAWARAHELVTDKKDAKGKPVPLRVTLGIIRLTHVELHQRPVAHSERTLATTYLARNRGNLAEYQKVVADALATEVAKAKVRGVMATFTEDDLRRAQEKPEEVAAAYGVDVATLKRMIDGELDTVMNACADNTGGQHAPVGQPCRASFMQCLDCPCARALPRHLPIQVLVHDRIVERRAQLPALQWAQRFAAPHAQLADLLSRHSKTALDDARAAATEADRALVTRFLDRELDLR
ncbi:hypothetical protein ACGILS_02350 [Streptomyces albidoflavus]|uniref:hypothetical protein n=1 Tax=Streptomyces albidoflavus TaxID=1886 RepID=UPI0021D5813F|nr:hypothetical protein [Streptomyces albidoflavus]MCU7705107.1 hypothetical protein [Streptomyces albidoflavus]